MSKTAKPGRPAPQSPEPATAHGPGLVAPRQIGWAAKLLWLAAGLQLVATILGIINISSEPFRAQARAALAAQGRVDDGAAIVDVAVKFSIMTAIGMGVIAILVYLTLAAFIGRGAMWARLAGGVVAIGSLYQLTGLTMPGGAVTIAQLLAGLAAITLCYIKPASTFFREKQVERLKGRMR